MSQLPMLVFKKFIDERKLCLSSGSRDTSGGH